MSELDNVVKLTISRQSTGLSSASFGSFAIVSEFAANKTTVAFERIREYADLAEMTTDGWSASDKEYKAAQKVFSQNPSLTSIKIGRKTPDAEAVETWTAALTAIEGIDSEWYCFILISTVEADLKEAAAWAETATKIFFYSSKAVGIKDGAVTNDIASFMKSQNYDRTVSIYHTADQDDATAPSFIESALPGSCLPFAPGSQTWAYKTLAGVASYKLTSGEKTAIENKNCNTYIAISGVDVTQYGVVASGEYIDVIRGLDWLEARIKENVFSAFINGRKIPYTDAGIKSIALRVSTVLQEAVRAGVLAQGSVVVTVPTVSQIPEADRIARNLPDVSFTARLAGAIHNVSISGTVTV